MLLDMGNWKPNGNDTAENMKSLQKWLSSLTDGINDCLCSIDAGNLDDAFYATLKATKVVADTIISNTNITQEIYASYGNIAKLTVYKLRTDYEKAQKYLDADTSDVDYINIHDETISFITSKVTDGTTQLVDGNDKFYWTDDTHTQMTSEKTTDYPVTIYNYIETVKASIAFKTVTLPSGIDTVMPLFTLGAGTGEGDSAKGYIYKGADGLYFDYYSQNDGKVRRILLGDDGVVISPYEFKALDVYNNGFVATYSGDRVAMNWTLDGNGRITALTTEDNVTIPITWHGGNM